MSVFLQKNDDYACTMCKFVHNMGMAIKIRDLVAILNSQGFEQTKFGKGSHRRFKHRDTGVSVTIPGKDGDDAKIYLERQVRKAIEDVATRLGE